VLSPLTWRLADLGAKRAFLKAGLGWGHMPSHMVMADIESGALVKIRVEGTSRDMTLPMKVVYRKAAPSLRSSRASKGRRHAEFAECFTYRIWRVAGDDRQQRAWRERGIASA